MRRLLRRGLRRLTLVRRPAAPLEGSRGREFRLHLRNPRARAGSSRLLPVRQLGQLQRDRRILVLVQLAGSSRLRGREQVTERLERSNARRLRRLNSRCNSKPLLRQLLLK